MKKNMESIFKGLDDYRKTEMNYVMVKNMSFDLGLSHSTLVTSIKKLNVRT